MNRSYVAVAALAVILPLAGCEYDLHNPLAAEALLNQGRHGTSIAVPDVTAEVCVGESGAALVSGAVTVSNAGRMETQGLEIAVRVERRVVVGPFRDVPGAATTVVVDNQLPAGGIGSYPFELGLTPVPGASYRLTIHATITNHSGHPGTPWGPEPKRPLPSRSFVECEAPAREIAVTITDPEDGSTFAEGTPITFAGTAADTGGNDFSGELAWASDLDGDLGTGASITAALGPGEHTVTASVTDWSGANVSAAITVVVEPVQLCELGEVLTRLWRGESDGAWSNPANWEPAGIPTVADHAGICASAPRYPVLGASSTVGGLFVEEGAVLHLAGWMLTAAGDVNAAGGVAGPGTLVLAGNGATVRGTVPDLRVTGTVSADGDLVVAGDLTITGSAALLELGGSRLDVTGDLRTQNSGVLRMVDPADRLIVAGNAAFVAAVAEGNLTAGELRIAGHFSSGTHLGFRATGGHRIVLNGAAPQSVSFTQTSATSSRFQHLDIVNPAGVGFASAAYVGGSLALAADAGAVTGALTVTVAGDMADPSSVWNVANTTFTGSPALPATLQTNATFTGAAVLAGDLSITGNLTVSGSGALFELAGHVVAVGGNLRTQSGGVLRMADPADRLAVAGDAVFAAGVADGNLTSGELRVAGHFNVTANLGFRASGAHRVILDGAAAQNVTFAAVGATSSRFQHLDVVNAAGVNATSHLYIGGSTDLIGRMAVSTGRNVTTAADLALRASAILDNEGTVTYCGELTDEGATIIGNPPVPGC